MSSLGIKIDQFDVPVCNSFQAKMLNDQLCYEVDLNRFRTNNITRDLELGLVFFMDYNEDRQVSMDVSFHMEHDGSLGSKFDGFDYEENAFIYLNTIGNNFFFHKECIRFLIFNIFRTNQNERRRKI